MSEDEELRILVFVLYGLSVVVRIGLLLHQLGLI